MSNKPGCICHYYSSLYDPKYPYIVNNYTIHNIQRDFIKLIQKMKQRYDLT